MSNLKPKTASFKRVSPAISQLDLLLPSPRHPITINQFSCKWICLATPLAHPWQRAAILLRPQKKIQIDALQMAMPGSPTTRNKTGKFNYSRNYPLGRYLTGRVVSPFSLGLFGSTCCKGPSPSLINRSLQRVKIILIQLKERYFAATAFLLQSRTLEKVPSYTEAVARHNSSPSLGHRGKREP